MLERINKTVKTNIPLTGGYMWVILRHNEDCSNISRERELIICKIYKGTERNDNQCIEKLIFDGYLKFKIFKNLICNNQNKTVYLP